MTGVRVPYVGQFPVNILIILQGITKGETFFLIGVTMSLSGETSFCGFKSLKRLF